MPLPIALASLARDEAFWSRWYWQQEGAAYAELEGSEGIVPLGGRHSLALRLDAKLACPSLWLVSHGAADVKIAWDDQAHWHPDVLRWEEVETIARCGVIADRIPHPGLVVLLLARFAPIGPEEAPLAFPLIEAAAAAVGVASPYERLDRHNPFRWRRIDEDWVLEQDEVSAGNEICTLRFAASDFATPFPFRRWAEAMDDAYTFAATVPSRQ